MSEIRKMEELEAALQQFAEIGIDLKRRELSCRSSNCRSLFYFGITFFSSRRATDATDHPGLAAGENEE
jgi:hypothetical protein